MCGVVVFGDIFFQFEKPHTALKAGPVYPNCKPCIDFLFKRLYIMIYCYKLLPFASYIPHNLHRRLASHNDRQDKNLSRTLFEI